MSDYNHTLTLTIPASLYEVACAIGRALDPDIGGDKSFGQQDPEATTYTTSTPCTADFYEKAQYMLSHPEALHQRCLDDYAARWPELVLPTLEECEAFCAQVVMPIPDDPAET